jgi:UDP-N-acetylmuramate: L-alanyl-gamma-D-glutamyl-meso-diaminopimelate ligase
VNIYILGICGTFMAGVAQIARELGHEVEGSDANVYPPMSTQLERAGIGLHNGYEADALPRDCDMFIVGNAISRGNPQFEAILEQGRRYCSGPQWLYENLLHDRWVLAVAGTHGKTPGLAAERSSSSKRMNTIRRCSTSVPSSCTTTRAR